MAGKGNDIREFNHVDLLFPGKYVKAADLQGRDVVVVIEEIEPRHELMMAGSKKDYKPAVKLRGKEKLWVLNKTNAKTIAGMYGNEVLGWIGKAITLFPTTTQAAGREHECIRVRPAVPKQSSSSKPAPASDVKRALDSARTDAELRAQGAIATGGVAVTYEDTPPEPDWDAVERAVGK
jgi:hypothetical protein